MPVTANNWVAKLFPIEWGYIAKKSSGPRDLKSLATAFYQFDRERGIDDEVKLDNAKFFNPIKPLNLGLRFIMNKIQDYVDYYLLREKDHDYIGTSVHKDFSLSNIPQRLLKGMLLSPFLIISAPLRLLDKGIDEIVSTVANAGIAIINTNKTTRQSLKTEEISRLFKKRYVTDFNHSTSSIDAIDPLRVINPARLLNLSLAILTLQTATLIDNLLPGQDHASSIPARALKGLLITPLILINTPFAILDNVIDNLLSPFKPLVELTSNSTKDLLSGKNASVSQSTATIVTPTTTPSETSFISTVARLIQKGIASFKSNFSEHGLTISNYRELKKDDDNKADLQKLRQLHREYKIMAEKIKTGYTMDEANDFNSKKEKINSLIERLKTRLPASTLSPTTPVAQTSSPTSSATPVDAKNLDQPGYSYLPSMGA